MSDLLSPEEIIARAESHQGNWCAWAVFWLAIGALVGAAATLVLVAIKAAQ